MDIDYEGIKTLFEAKNFNTAFQRPHNGDDDEPKEPNSEI